MKVWRLKKGSDRRIRQGHPWIFASELAHSAKEVSAGELVELHDSQDHFLAIGYAHPSSQICFRKLTANAKEKDAGSVDFFIRRLQVAREHRQAFDWNKFSHRWLYAEADGVPGLVADAFLGDGDEWRVVVQASTAGMERMKDNVFAALETFSTDLGSLTLIDAPSSRSRLMEGLKIEPKRVVSGSSVNLEKFSLRLMDDVRLSCDLLNGQKTGFFLDQQWNIGLLKQLLRTRSENRSGPIRILDICCYVGQWAAHSVQTLKAAGVPAEVTLLDASEVAMGLAKENLAALGVTPKLICADALDGLGSLQGESFDVVICDPPAFVKKKADLEGGTRAYVKLNRDSLKLVKPGGTFVTCSCSGLVSYEGWRTIVREAGSKAGRGVSQWATGGHGPDHPLRSEFPEGEYLKCIIGRVSYPY